MAEQTKDTAHELRNYLTSILSNLALAKEHVAENDVVLQLLNEAEQAASEASRLFQGSDPEKSRKQKDSEKQTSGRSSNGRVLLVDDEEQVRKSTSRILVHLKFEVEVAEDGRTAVSKYKEALSQDRRFDAVIIDLSMPGGMDGLETLSKLYEEDESIKAIASSGYINDPVLENYHDYGFDGAIMKPYRISELQQVIQQVLS